MWGESIDSFKIPLGESKWILVLGCKFLTLYRWKVENAYSILINHHTVLTPHVEIHAKTGSQLMYMLTPGVHSDILVYTSWTWTKKKKCVKRGLSYLCSRMHKAGSVFWELINAIFSENMGWFCQLTLLKFFRVKPTWGVKFEIKSHKSLFRGDFCIMTKMCSGIF